MKVLNTTELDYLIDSVSFLKGAEFQTVLGLRDIIVLKFWDRGVIWLLFNLSLNTPFFLAFKKETPLNTILLNKAKKRPLNLFLHTHFKGSSLTNIQRIKEYGRLIRFYFNNSTEFYIEFRAYPGGLNLTAVKKGKQVYWAKPLLLSKLSENYFPKAIRSPDVIIKQGLDFLRVKNDDVQIERQIDKIATAKMKIKEGLKFLRSDGYKRFSEFLVNETKLVRDLEGLYKKKLSLRENIEWGYKQQKLKDVKIKRLEKRLIELAQKTSVKKNLKILKSKTDKARVLRFLEISKEIRAFCGKSAKENMELLRKAKSWYIWMHLKDYPSGHLILDIPKNYKISEKDLKQCGLFLFKTAAPKKLHSVNRVKFEVIFTEVKFVKSVKSAKNGLVQPSRIKTRLYEWEIKN